MGNYTIFSMFGNPRRGRQASKTFDNKCSKNSRSQIVFRTDIFRKLTLGAPEKASLPVGVRRSKTPFLKFPVVLGFQGTLSSAILNGH